MSTAREYPQGDTVRVFRDDAVWDRHSAWFLVPAPKLEELHVATYRLDVDDQGDPINPVGDLEYIEQQHPGCVYVY